MNINTHSQKGEYRRGEFTLPLHAITRSGVQFFPTSERWSFRDGVFDVSMDFTHFSHLSEAMLLSMKAVLMWIIQTYSSRYAVGQLYRMKKLSKFIVENFGECLQAINFEHLEAFRSANVLANEPCLAGLAALLKKWFSLGYPGVEESAVRYLSDIKLKGYEKGVAVRTMDPRMGPFTVMETEAILSALVKSLAKREIDIEGYLMAWLFIAFGVRPVQVAAMKVCDLKAVQGSEGEETYLLSIPRAKQQGVKHHRELSKDRAVLPEVGRMFEVHIEKIKSKLQDHFRDLSAAPLFPHIGSKRSSLGFEFHRTASNIGLQMKLIMRSLGVMSERTGEELHITPIRFRRTVGTRAAEEGFGLLVIAELLDHSDTQNAGIYTEATPAIIERIDRAVAMQMAPLAQAFSGKLIKDESEATRGTAPSSRIVDLRIDQTGSAMGSCGQESYCGFSAPIACYRCACFEPWQDGPHEAVLQFLLDKRERLIASTNNRIASVNDLTILAVAEVVRQCSEYNRKKPRSRLG